VIEERRIQIEKFLQVVLAAEEVKKSPENRKEILKSLNLPLNFYELPEVHQRESQSQSFSHNDSSNYAII
jgi:hypothetical protein